MPYIIEKIEEQLSDALAKPEDWVARNPAYADIYADIADLRRSHQEAGATLKTPDWKLVAKLRSTQEDVQRFLNPEFLRDKKVFYAWLDRNPQYCAYDRRRGRRGAF